MTKKDLADSIEDLQKQGLSCSFRNLFEKYFINKEIAILIHTTRNEGIILLKSKHVFDIKDQLLIQIKILDQ